MRAALARAEAAWGPLHGAFYLPGQQGPAHCLRGALVLDRLLGEERPLDVLVLFGGLEPPPAVRHRADLWAAIALLDALAQERAGRSAGRTVAIDWGRMSFDRDEAFAALDRVLCGPALAQVAVPGEAAAEGEDEQAAGADGAAAQDDVPADDPVAQRVAAAFSEALGLRRVGLEDSFFDLGGDSLVALQVMARLREDFALELPVRTLLERPTVAQMRTAVEEALIARLEELSEEEAARLVQELG
jgi:acyl carrier protein